MKNESQPPPKVLSSILIEACCFLPSFLLFPKGVALIIRRSWVLSSRMTFPPLLFSLFSKGEKEKKGGKGKETRKKRKSAKVWVWTSGHSFSKYTMFSFQNFNQATNRCTNLLISLSQLKIMVPAVVTECTHTQNLPAKEDWGTVDERS